MHSCTKTRKETDKAGAGCRISYTLHTFISFFPYLHTGRRGMVYMQNAEEKAKKVSCTYINPTPCTRILHPILHPKSPVNTGNLTPWCRKCRRFSKTFFVEGEREKAVQWSGNSKTSDFFGQKYGCFASKVRMFSSKKSDVFVFRKGNYTI